MKIYEISKSRNRRVEIHSMPAEVSALKKAAGGEDMVILTAEAINSFQRDNFTKTREMELAKLALRHINDYRPELENLENDTEFIKAEKLALLAELVIRITTCAQSRNIHGRVSDFVVQQLTDR